MNTTRTTPAHLESLVARINSLTNSPTQPYSEVNGKFSPNANCYHLDYAYGGVMLVRMSSTPGCTGISTPLGTGHISKRDLYERMTAFVRGLENH